MTYCKRCAVARATLSDSLCDRCRGLAETKVFTIKTDGERIAQLEAQVKQLCDLLGDLEPIQVRMTLQDGKQHELFMLRITSATIRPLPTLTVLPPPTETQPPTNAA